MSAKGDVDVRSERNQMIEYLSSQLIGPIDGTLEEFIGSPLDRYLLGVLYPQSANAMEMVNEEEAEASSGGEEEEEVDNPISLAFEKLPASMGISFYLEGTNEVICDVWGSQYEYVGKVDDEDQWRRIPLAEASSPARHILKNPALPDTEPTKSVLENRASLHTIWRPLGKGHLVTVTLLNNAHSDSGQPDPKFCLFQAGVSCSVESGMISDYPMKADPRLDPEEEELALLYREQRIFAVGHGCAASWEGSGGDLSVRTDVMPVHEAFSLAHNKKLADTKEEYATLDRAFSLAYLADESISIKDLSADLSVFKDLYCRWIGLREKEVGQLPQIHQHVAERLIKRMNSAADRMQRGIEAIQNDENVARAFRLATRAMLMQMVHSGKDFGGTMKDRNMVPFKEPMYEGKTVQQFKWYPFQLAFQLLTLESVVNPHSEHRELVDLIWFPTGGGKTEAYLWVATLELFLRRLRHGDRGAGTAVIKRYTLRLLTSQQFQRAATLICACERLRQSTDDLGTEPFSLGLWIGSQSTPNEFIKAKDQYDNLLAEAEPENPFQLQYCPWCGTRIVPRTQQEQSAYGVFADSKKFKFFCPTDSCPFHETLPIAVVDQEMYLRPPSMIIGTIDKFAQLAWDDSSKSFFGGKHLPPSLIIQDELHLISGPLGTIAGVYEAAIDCLLTQNGIPPKIIAATATIRRAREQAQRLYAREVIVFPPSGLKSSDSYFARLDQSTPGRMYVGVMGQGHTPVTSLLRATAAVCQAPVELDTLDEETKDAYWTVLVYHNSKRELGKTMNLARDDIPARILIIAKDESRAREVDNVEELSANLAGRRIPEVLELLKKKKGGDAIDILSCTNMISVGVDIKRLGAMVVVGQPKTTAEYIQATSRVGRAKVPGLVITMYSPTKPRDRSHYEGFKAYHGALYRWVEPTSVTPYALPSRERALPATLVIIMRHLAGLNANGAAQDFDPEREDVQKLTEWLIDRMSKAEPEEAAATERHIKRLVEEWAARARDAQQGRTGPLRYNGSGGNQYKSLLCTFDNPKEKAWPTLHSMRHVDSEARIWVNGEPTNQPAGE